MIFELSGSRDLYSRAHHVILNALCAPLFFLLYSPWLKNTLKK